MISMQVAHDTVKPLLLACLVAGKDMTSPMRSISAQLRNDTLRNFRDGGWFPAKWKPSCAAADGHKTLVRTATLRNSFHAAFGKDFASIGTDCPYAAVHQFGATINAKTSKGLRFKIGGQWRNKKSITIPARPILPIDAAGRLPPSTDKYIGDRLLNHLMGVK